MSLVDILDEFRKVFDNERDKGTAFEKLVKIYLENGCGRIFLIGII